MPLKKVVFNSQVRPQDTIRFSFHGRNKPITNAVVLSNNAGIILYENLKDGSLGELRPSQLQTLKVYRFVKED